jgi:hypothetical protein
MFLFSPYDSLYDKIDHLPALDCIGDAKLLPSSLGGTSYSGSRLLRKLAERYSEGTLLEELFGRTDLSLESLEKPNSILQELGVRPATNVECSEKELYERFHRKESDPIQLRKTFESEYVSDKI